MRLFMPVVGLIEQRFQRGIVLCGILVWYG
jgi:hypothetical protein